MEKYLTLSIFIFLSCTAFETVYGQGSWGGGSTWSNAAGHAVASAGPGTTDQQYSYGYAGMDSRGPYGGAGGNGAYYVSGADDRGQVYSYGGNGGAAGQPGQPGYGPNRVYQDGYYRSGATRTATTTTTTLTTTFTLFTTILGLLFAFLKF